MKFAKFLRKTTACSAAFVLIACSSSPSLSPAPDFNRSEAMKARINLALAYLEQNDFPKAKENIDKALNHDQNDYLPYSVQAYYFQQTGDAAGATESYQEALKLSRNRPDVLNNYGTFLCKQGQFRQAYHQFEQAVQSKQPYYHQADSLENIVLCARKEPNPAKVAEALARLEKLDKARAEKLR